MTDDASASASPTSYQYIESLFESTRWAAAVALAVIRLFALTFAQ